MLRMAGFLKDLRYAIRQLRKNPGFTAVAVFTLALGIGANTAIFSLIDAVLLRPLPYQEANRLVMLWEQNPHRGWFENIVSGANFRDWKKENHVFTDIAAFQSNSYNLTGNGRPEEIFGEKVTTNLFSLLGVRPLRGRLFLPEEETKGRGAAIVSYGLWQQRYGGDPDLVGKTILLNGEVYPVVGILPASFGDDYSSSLDPHSQVWISGIEPFEEGREMHFYRSLARLKPGVTFAQAQAEMNTIAGRIEQQYSDSKGWGIALVRLHDQTVAYARPALLVLLGAVALVLLIACANVANLLLVRATGRHKETAIRRALGASGTRLVRQFLVESTLLALMGAAAGLGFAAWGSQLLVRLSPPRAAQIEGAGINGAVLLFTVALAMGTGVIFGLAPALGAAKADVNEALKESGRSYGSARDRRLRDVLVVCELGLALALLVSAGLMIKALTHLHGVQLGFNPDHVRTMKVRLEGSQHEDIERQVEFFRELSNRIEALPGVEAATISRAAPMRGWSGWGFVTAENPHPTAGEIPDANYIPIGPHYFQTLQIPLREGRPFADSDTSNTQPVVIVSESLATNYWPNQDPIGKRLKIADDADDQTQPWRTVVGVAGNVRTQGQYVPFVPELYVPYTQIPWILQPRNILVRSVGDPSAILPAIQHEVAALDNNVPISEVMTMNEVVAGPVQQGQTVMWLLGALATLALILSAVGIYSVISYGVSQRTREIGIRMAMGASHRDVATLIVKQGFRLALVGLAMGLLAAFTLGRLFAALPLQVRELLLFDVHAIDPLIFGVVSTILLAVALLGSFIPARRAAKVDPMVALRYE
jgi:putative ABC transport system permease protein